MESVEKQEIIDVKALSLDVYAALHSWTSEIQFQQDLMHTLLDIVEVIYYVINAAIIVAPAALFLSCAITATNKWLDQGTAEEEQFLFLTMSIFSGILFLAI